MKAAIAAAAVAICLAMPAVASRQARIAHVTDADTFRLESGERIRIAGIDAPETQKSEARCAAEISHGRAAAQRARALLTGRTVELERVGRSYNRTVARVQLDGRDLAEQLIAMGLARPWRRGEPKPDWCARP